MLHNGVCSQKLGKVENCKTIDKILQEVRSPPRPKTAELLHDLLLCKSIANNHYLLTTITPSLTSYSTHEYKPFTDIPSCILLIHKSSLALLSRKKKKEKQEISIVILDQDKPMLKNFISNIVKVCSG